MRIGTAVAAGIAALAAAACRQEEPQIVYQALPAETRDIIVSVQASGTVQPDTVVEVKSKASGEVLDLHVETGQIVERGALMVSVDPRVPRNTLAQAQADLAVARASLQNAESKKRRADELFKTQSITEQEQEQAVLDYAMANASVVRAQVSIETARDQLDDTQVRAPINGTIISKQVERGTVISSPTSDVGGGTVLLTMADLNLVQLRTLVDETDIGKITPGLSATITVDAFPNRPFEGEVLKIEPLAEVQQNVTMFPVIIRIANREGLLRPGMNAEVEIHVGRREGVLAIPNAALRTERDVASAASVLGLDPAAVQAQLADARRPTATDSADTTGQRASLGAATPGGGANTMTLPNGSSVTLPAGATEAQIRAIMAKRSSGDEPTAEERALIGRVFQGMRRGGAAGRARQGAGGAQAGGNYVVFVKRNGAPEPIAIRTGLTDLDYSEVVSGLSEGDSVLVLPSAGLVESQQEMRERMERVTGGGVPGMRR